MSMWDFISEYILPIVLVILIIFAITFLGLGLYIGIKNVPAMIQTEDNICNCVKNNAKEE